MCGSIRGGQRSTVSTCIRHCNASDVLDIFAQSQLLDEDHLLLSLGAPDANAHRAADAGQQYALIVVYSVAAARITAVFNNSRHEAPQRVHASAYEATGGSFLTADYRC